MRQLYVLSCCLSLLLVSLFAYKYYLYASSYFPARGSLSFERLRETLEERKNAQEGCSGLTSMSSQTYYLIECVKNLQKDWIQNSQKAKELRSSLKELHTAESFATSFRKDSTSKKSPFENRTYNVCSLVGSSGVLSGSKCQREIDSADFIFRFNAPKIAPFGPDAGWKTNFTSINPIGVVKDRYNGLQDEVDKKHFLLDMNQYNDYMWMSPTVATSASFKRVKALQRYFAIRVAKTLTQYESDMKVPALLIGNESHHKEVQKYWANTLGINPENTYLTTGFYITSVALSFCNEVRLYGFWPFPVDLNQESIPYHYYDGVKVSYRNSWHDFKSEFFTLLRLHTEGILKLHVGSCQS